MKIKLFMTFIIFHLFLLCFITWNVNYVLAEEIEYSLCYDDLTKDKTFSLEKYPYIKKDELKDINFPYVNSSSLIDKNRLLDVISVAEGYNNELYIYVYHPTKKSFDFKCLSVSMFISDNPNPLHFDVFEYDLEYLSSHETIDKYLVKNYTVATGEQYRYYNIVGISIPFHEAINTEFKLGTTDDIDVGIGQQWCVYKYNGSLVYESCDLLFVDIEPTHNGFLVFKHGVTWKDVIGSFEFDTQLSFISFDVTNFNIKHIYDVEIGYYYQKVAFYKYNCDSWFNFTFEDHVVPIDETATYHRFILSDTDEFTFNGKGLLAKDFNFDRIMSGSDFVEFYNDKGGTLNEESENIIKDSDWIFCFADFEYKLLNNRLTLGGYEKNVGTIQYFTQVSEFDIYRISFLDENVDYYNLGVVMNKTTADKIVDGLYDPYKFDDSNILELLEKILFIFAFVLLLIVGFYIFPIIEIIVKVIVFILNGIWTIISYPFKIFKRK